MGSDNDTHLVIEIASYEPSKLRITFEHYKLVNGKKSGTWLWTVHTQENTNVDYFTYRDDDNKLYWYFDYDIDNPELVNVDEVFRILTEEDLTFPSSVSGGNNSRYLEIVSLDRPFINRQYRLHPTAYTIKVKEYLTIKGTDVVPLVVGTVNTVKFDSGALNDYSLKSPDMDLKFRSKLFTRHSGETTKVLYAPYEWSNTTTPMRIQVKIIDGSTRDLYLTYHRDGNTYKNDKTETYNEYVELSLQGQWLKYENNTYNYVNSHSAQQIDNYEMSSDTSRTLQVTAPSATYIEESVGQSRYIRTKRTARFDTNHYKISGGELKWSLQPDNPINVLHSDIAPLLLDTNVTFNVEKWYLMHLGDSPLYSALDAGKVYKLHTRSAEPIDPQQSPFGHTSSVFVNNQTGKYIYTKSTPELVDLIDKRTDQTTFFESISSVYLMQQSQNSPYISKTDQLKLDAAKIKEKFDNDITIYYRLTLNNETQYEQYKTNDTAESKTKSKTNDIAESKIESQEATPELILQYNLEPGKFVYITDTQGLKQLRLSDDQKYIKVRLVPESVAGGDPYIYPCTGPPYKLPNAYDMYRLYQDANIVINAEVSRATPTIDAAIRTVCNSYYVTPDAFFFTRLFVATRDAQHHVALDLFKKETWSPSHSSGPIRCTGPVLTTCPTVCHQITGASHTQTVVSTTLQCQHGPHLQVIFDRNPQVQNMLRLQQVHTVPHCSGLLVRNSRPKLFRVSSLTDLKWIPEPDPELSQTHRGTRGYCEQIVSICAQ